MKVKYFCCVQFCYHYKEQVKSKEQIEILCCNRTYLTEGNNLHLFFILMLFHPGVPNLAVPKPECCLSFFRESYDLFSVEIRK